MDGQTLDIVLTPFNRNRCVHHWPYASRRLTTKHGWSIAANEKSIKVKSYADQAGDDRGFVIFTVKQEHTLNSGTLLCGFLLCKSRARVHGIHGDLDRI